MWDVGFYPPTTSVDMLCTYSFYSLYIFFLFLLHLWCTQMTIRLPLFVGELRFQIFKKHEKSGKNRIYKNKKSEKTKINKIFLKNTPPPKQNKVPFPRVPAHKCFLRVNLTGRLTNAWLFFSLQINVYFASTQFVYL